MEISEANLVRRELLLRV